MKKIYDYLVDLGSAVAAFLAFTPFISLYLYKYTDKWWIILIVSILYDIYWYDNITKK